jgi:hypothetical protein
MKSRATNFWEAREVETTRARLTLIKKHSRLIWRRVWLAALANETPPAQLTLHWCVASELPAASDDAN